MQFSVCTAWDYPVVDEHNPNHKGNVAELAIAKEAAELGLSVLMPMTEHERYADQKRAAGRSTLR